MTDCADDCDLAAICSARHWSIYWIIILCSLIFVSGRIITVGITNAKGTTPFMSANDRSRWTTIRALGDRNTYEIDDVIAESPDGIYWDTIDKVQHPGRDGRSHSYSSKPTLLPTLLSFVYRGVKLATGMNLDNDTLPIVRVVLLIINAIPWAIFLWLLGKCMETIAVRDWTRYFVVAVAGFGTFLSTFAVTLNNHLPAAVCVMAVLYGLLRIVNGQRRDWLLFAMIGLTSAFAAANELPALSLLLVAGLICGGISPLKFVLGFLPAAAIVIAGFFWTNFAAHNDWRPPYAHRGDGELLFEFSLDAKEAENALPDNLSSKLAELEFVAPAIEPAAWASDSREQVDRWVISDINGQRLTLRSNKATNTFSLHAWDNWYDYPGSYWLTTNERKSRIDQGEPDSTVYLFHVLFGHHGIFSLTPIWWLSAAGMFSLLFIGNLRLRWLAVIAIGLSILLVGFYVFWVPEADRNYGGRCSAFRWAFWLAPIWLVCMSPIVDWLGKTKTGRALCLLLLAVSALSASYSWTNPWTHPWLYELSF